MKAVKLLAMALGAYIALVVAFESVVGIMGERHAKRGLQPGENWLVITTKDVDGSVNDTVVAGVESDGQLYVAANHWLRAWYFQAVKNPVVKITRRGESMACRAVPIAGTERARIARDSTVPWAIRVLTGFPPRSFLRLDPLTLGSM